MGETEDEIGDDKQPHGERKRDIKSEERKLNTVRNLLQEKNCSAENCVRSERDWKSQHREI